MAKTKIAGKPPQAELAELWGEEADEDGGHDQHQEPLQHARAIWLRALGIHKPRRQSTRVALAQYRHTDHFHAAHMRDLGDTDAYPLGMKIMQHHMRNMLGQGFEELEMPVFQVRTDALNDLTVIHRIANIVGLARLMRIEPDLQIKIERLRFELLPLIDADPSFGAHFANEYGVHGNVL